MNNAKINSFKNISYLVNFWFGTYIIGVLLELIALTYDINILTLIFTLRHAI